MSIKDPVEINVSLDVNKTLKSTEEMAKAIEKADPRTNTYMPLSAGIESTAALVYAAKDPNLHAFCCLLYTSPSPRDATLSRMPSSA
mgnify:CR=1 FL=1